MKRAVVLGGGFAGVEAAIQLRRKGFKVELVSERDYLFLYPISIWIPVSTLPFEEAKVSLAAVAETHGFDLTVDRVVSVDAGRRTFTLERGGTRQEERVVLALGAGKTRLPGQEHTLSICGDPAQSLELKTRIGQLIQQEQGRIAFGFGGNPKDASAVRGGPAFELFFNLDHRLRKLGLRDRFEMTFFAPMASPGARMGGKALRMLSAQFERHGFRSRYGVRLKGFRDGTVDFEDGSELQADLIMFIPAGNGHPAVTSSDLPLNEAGFVRIEPTCQVSGVPGWYAAGDVAALEGPDWKAKQGHLAVAMARLAAENLALDAAGSPAPRSTYADKLSILCLMDMGNGGGLVYRDDRRDFMIPLPIAGHWLKRLWGHHYKAVKLGRLAKVPGI